MLLTKEVEIGLANRCTYYESKGYVIPKRRVNGVDRPYRNTKITVKVEDLPKGSHAIISWQCDKCKTVYNETYKSFLHHKFDDGKCYCLHCSSGIYTSREKHFLWRNDLSDEDRKNSKNRHKDPEYTLFVRRVMWRDNYTCYKCGESSSNHMNVHHLYNYADYPELRTDIDNGVCLCENCHKLFHNIYGRNHNTREQFEEWIDKSLTLQYDASMQVNPSRPIYCLEDSEIIYNLTNYCKSHKGCYTSSIRKNCNKLQSNVNGKHYLWYDVYCDTEDIDEYINDLHKRHQRSYEQYIKMKNNENFKKIKKQVVCIELKLLFNSITDATKYVGLKSNASICMACKNGNIASDYHWCYFNDYIDDANELKKVRQI